MTLDVEEIFLIPNFPKHEDLDKWTVFQNTS